MAYPFVAPTSAYRCSCNPQQCACHHATVSSLGHLPLMPHSTFKVEESRFEALRDWAEEGQKYEQKVREARDTLSGSTLRRGEAEATFWESMKIWQGAEIRRVTAQARRAADTRLDEIKVRKMKALIGRAEEEGRITKEDTARQAKAQATRAEHEVHLVYGQIELGKAEKAKVEAETSKVEVETQKTLAEKGKADAECHVAGAQKEKFDAERGAENAKRELHTAQGSAAAAKQAASIAERDKFGAEREKFIAERDKFVAEKEKLRVEAESRANAPPSPQEMKNLITKLWEMEPCVSGYPWADSPAEGGFRCEGGKHFKTYAKARSMIRA